MAGVVSPSASEVHSDIASPFNVFISLLLPAVLLYYVYWRLSRRNMLKLAEKIPGPPGLPIIGNALDFLGTSHGKLHNELIILPHITFILKYHSHYSFSNNFNNLYVQKKKKFPL